VFILTLRLNKEFIITMNPEQFHAFQQQIQDNEHHRRNEEARRFQDTVRTKLIDRLCNQTIIADGTDPNTIREWIWDVELTIPQTDGAGSTIDIATRTTRGPLRREIELFLQSRANENPPVPRNQVHWDDLKQHITEVFLAIDEQSYLRNQLETIEQSPYEAVTSFNRRFRDIAMIAYPVPRNNEHERELIKSYLRALSMKEMAAEISIRQRPATIQDAMTAAVEFATGTERFNRLGRRDERHEQPMEIGAMSNSKTPSRQNPPPSTSNSNSELTKMMKGIQSGLDKLQNEVTQLKQKQNENQARPQPSRNQYRWTPDGRPICFACGQVGHFRFQCQQTWQSPRQPTFNNRQQSSPQSQQTPQQRRQFSHRLNYQGSQ